jgi:hypothetical protein
MVEDDETAEKIPRYIADIRQQPEIKEATSNVREAQIHPQ